MITATDMYVLLKVALIKGSWEQKQVAFEAHVSPSTVSNALKQAQKVSLYNPVGHRVNALALEEAVVHGARYYIGTSLGSFTRGMPTAWALKELSIQPPLLDIDPVWPTPTGEKSGLAVEPLHKSAPLAATESADFYRLLAVVDIFRIGSRREVSFAKEEFRRLVMGE